MKTTFFAAVVASLLLLVSATVWEGVSAVVPSGDLPGFFSIATNSFPKNSVVDITNLENGKTVRVMVVSGLETTGLLAMLSVNAAESIDLRGNSTCRTRMTQPSDDIAFSHFKLGPIAPDALYEPQEASVADVESSDYIAGADALPPDGLAEADRAGEYAAAAEADAAETDVVEAAEIASEPEKKPAPKPGIISGPLVLNPAEERLPEKTGRYVIAPENVIAPLKPAAVYSTPSDFSPFQVPLISSLEQGKCYVQIAVYTRPDNVEDEINRIGKGYPVAIQNIGSDIKPMFRVLLGPLNQGESAAMLQRFKSIGYDDAFVRQN